MYQTSTLQRFYFKSKRYKVFVEGFCRRVFPRNFIFLFHIFLNNFINSICIQKLVMDSGSLLIEGIIYARGCKYCYYCSQIFQYTEILRRSFNTTYLEKFTQVQLFSKLAVKKSQCFLFYWIGGFFFHFFPNLILNFFLEKS